VWDADFLKRAADDLERLARRIRHDARPGWLTDAMEMERVARVHRARAAELTATTATETSR
jgi:hypothetical protein